MAPEALRGLYYMVRFALLKNRRSASGGQRNFLKKVPLASYKLLLRLCRFVRRTLIEYLIEEIEYYLTHYTAVFSYAVIGRSFIGRGDNDFFLYL